MTLYAETSAILLWLFAEDDGEALRDALVAADKVFCQVPLYNFVDHRQGLFE